MHSSPLKRAPYPTTGSLRLCVVFHRSSHVRLSYQVCFSCRSTTLLVARGGAARHFPPPGPFISGTRFSSYDSANKQFESFGPSSKHAELGPEAFGIIVFRFVGTVPDILGLVWRRFRPNSGSESKIPSRILKYFRGPFSSAEICAFGLFLALAAAPICCTP